MIARIKIAVLAACLACGSTATEPGPIPPIGEPSAKAPIDAAVVAGPKPEFLERAEALARGLCECADAQCIEERYVAFHRALDGQSLEGWAPGHVREMHVMRARGEDCNLSMLTGGDEALLETAREAFLDGYASRAPALLTQMYEAAVARHTAGKKLPGSSRPTPDKGSCCQWSDGLCPARRELWSGAPWTELGFAVTEAQAFSFEFERRGDVVTVRAFGDLDCDGELSTYELRGNVSSEPHPQIRMTKRLE